MPYKDKTQQKEAQRRNYLENKQKYYETRKRNRELRSEWFHNLKKQMRCANCGMQDSRCFDFHHRNPNEKKFGISEAVKNAYSEKRILNEMKKCDVMCVNCHIKFHGQKGCFYNERIQDNVEWVQKYKHDAGCIKCGIKDAEVLAFHHKIGVDKKDIISDMVWRGNGVTSLLKEIVKCDIICANCHRIEHNGNIWQEDSYKDR